MSRPSLNSCYRRLMLIVVLLPAVAHAESTLPASSVGYPESIFSTNYLRSIWDDSRAVLSEPAHWDEANWREASVWIGGTLLAAGFDHQIRNQAQVHYRTRGEDRFARQWQRLGAEYSFVEIAAFEAWGVAADNPQARETAMDAVTSTIIASGIVTPVLKYSVGRYRPTETTATLKFRPFSGHQSFPSGHTTQAFAVATVVASHFNEPWEQALSYGAATLVGLARVQQNAHFASDVVAGAGIGWAVARAVVHRHERPSATSFAIEPWVARDVRGLALTRSF